jgi:hypothetical protein
MGGDRNRAEVVRGRFGEDGLISTGDVDPGGVAFVVRLGDHEVVADLAGDPIEIDHGAQLGNHLHEARVEVIANQEIDGGGVGGAT